jgi:hypothetical protein
LPCNWSSSDSNSCSLIIAGGAVARRQAPAPGGRQGIGLEGALAVQLVEQRFEFVVGDFVTGASALTAAGGRNVGTNWPLPCN